MQREEKQLELSLEALISQVADLKNSLVSFIYKLENEYDRLTWPSVLDSFALLSGQLNTLNKVLKHEKTPLMRNQVIIPLVLSPDRDEEIMRQTEGRVPVFSHEVVPDHLRTKPDPEVEEQEKQLITDATRINAGQPPGSAGPVQASQPGAGAIIAGASGIQQVQMSGASSQQQPMLGGVQMSQAGQSGKIPSGIKTNIKSASMHPYQR
uniref:Mediator of RNA polymerase II transcription subunit 8 n=1 Tax=Terrapene triunguis TaxID=2587831 RepID=A0A674K3F7_9SAUR